MTAFQYQNSKTSISQTSFSSIKQNSLVRILYHDLCHASIPIVCIMLELFFLIFLLLSRTITANCFWSTLVCDVKSHNYFDTKRFSYYFCLFYSSRCHIFLINQNLISWISIANTSIITQISWANSDNCFWTKQFRLLPKFIISFWLFLLYLFFKCLYFSLRQLYYRI